MRGHAGGVGSVDMIIRALLEEFPELDPARVRIAVERGAARAASASLDTEGYKVVDMHLARVEETDEAAERAHILRDLSDNLEQRGDLDRALVVRLSAFAETPAAEDLQPLLRLARVTNRWGELPLDAMNALVDVQSDGAVAQLTELATAWQQVGRAYYAADCFERVLLIAPADRHAHDALETFYRSTGEWPVLIDLLGRQAVHVEKDKDRAELIREVAGIYERELDDADGALDAYREADRLEPDHPEVLDAIARLVIRVGDSDGEALTALERLARVTFEAKARARIHCRAADIAKIYDWDKAQKLYEHARKDDPELATAVDGLVALLRDRGQLADAIALLVKAADQAAGRSPTDRARWLADAGDYYVALGDTDSAMQVYRDARTEDPNNHRAGVALVELCMEGGDLRELVPILDELCRTTDDPARLRNYLLQRSKVAAELGDRTGARNALSRAVDLDPHDLASRRELAELLWQAQAWAKARELIERLLDHEDQLPDGAGIELHYRATVCAFELGDTEGAQMHAGATLALAPDHREALLIKAELDKADPVALAADQLALANIAPPEEKASRFTALGDRYMELGDRATAREMYREALVFRPGDHLLLTKFLELVADQGDWSYSLDLVKRLIETEAAPNVRARYRHTAAMIARDELHDPEQALELLEQALSDDPLQFGAADDLEAMLAHDPDAQMRFYYRRLEDVRVEEGRAGERVRLWDKLGDLCVRVGRYDDAVAAFEVALSLDPENLDRRQRLADLYGSASSTHDLNAIAQHQAVLRLHKKRVDSYKALYALYERTHQPEKARACDEALTILRAHLIEERIEALFERAPAPELARGVLGPHGRTLANDDWMALARIDVDLQLSALFALVAPPFAVERARMRAPQAVPAREADLPPQLQRVLGQVVAAFGIGRPPVYVDPALAQPCKVTMRAKGGVLVPVLLIGPSATAGWADDELAFLLARQLADLRTERIARLLCPRANELAQIIELASAVPGDAATHAARWLAGALHPVELAQAQAIGGRLRDRAVHPMSAAVGWLAATERAADRTGFVVVGDLATCVRVLEREPTHELNRVIELAWASVTEDVLGVRGRLEGWPAPHA